MIFLDFDGVLFDSAREAFEVGHLTVFGNISDPSDENRWRLFKSLRYIVTTAWHYRSVFDSIIATLDYEAASAALKDSITTGPSVADKEFEGKFFQQRKDWIERNREDWLCQSQPTPFFLNLAPLLVTHPRAFTILSTRNEESISEMLSMHLPVGDLKILGARAFSKHGESKANVILDETPSVGSLFVDDGIEHLEAASGIPGLELFHARWGYVDPSLAFNNANVAMQLVTANLKGV